MDTNLFIQHYRQAFGETTALPLVFWYTDIPPAESVSCSGCYIKALKAARDDGKTISMDAGHIGCGGGKLYAGFVPPHIGLAEFVSRKERYKQNVPLAEAFIKDFAGAEQAGKWIRFARIDRLDSFEGCEGVIFFATPDMLSGLVTWCLFDTNRPDAVSVPFGSGCSTITAHVVRENKTGGKRTFLGMFDPSARPCVEENILTYAIPMVRFREMYHTLAETCLVKTTPAWQKIRNRITGTSGNGQNISG